MSMVSPRRRALLWALVIFVAAVFLLLAIPVVKNRLVQGEMTGLLNNARQLQIAMQMMAMDLKNNGENARGGLPADLGVKSKAEYLARLTRDNYLSVAEATKITEGIAIVNVASTDSPETSVVVSDWYLHPERPHTNGLVTFTIGGSGGVYKREADAMNPNVVKLPNRQPQILPEQ